MTDTYLLKVIFFEIPPLSFHRAIGPMINGDDVIAMTHSGSGVRSCLVSFFVYVLLAFACYFFFRSLDLAFLRKIGKTAAVGISCLQLVDGSSKHVQALVLTPSRQHTLRTKRVCFIT